MTKPFAAVKNVTSYRVIYGDTDQMGVVYYANYLRWFESGRSELLRQIGLPYVKIEEQGFHFLLFGEGAKIIGLVHGSFSQ